MSIDIPKIKAGDEVRIANGDWYSFMGWEDDDPDIAKMAMLYKDGESYWPVPNGLITSHRPEQPKPPVEEWVTEEDVESARCLDGDLQPCLYTDDANALLTRKYGPPPIVRVYNGEPPEGFGLSKTSYILWFAPGAGIWKPATYQALAKGDRWMKQPAKPGEAS